MKKILAALTMAAFTMVVTPSFAQTQPEPQKKEEKKKQIKKKKGEEKKEEKK
jgi:spore coat polysaccharide biosynthesis predicted glycosyltransferase SpsG